MLRLSTFPRDVTAAPLAGLSTASAAAVTQADTVLAALGKLQAQGALNAQGAGNWGRNKLLNGRFAAQQRGAGPWTANGAYTADRWALAVNLDTVSAGIVALSDADRAAIGDEYAASAVQIAVAGSGTGFSQFAQHTEGVRALSGKAVTLSFFAKASAALSLGAYLFQSFGTGGSPSAAVYVAPASFALGTGFARYSATFSVPSAAGKALGTNGDDYTGLFFGLSASPAAAAILGVNIQSGTIALFGAQLEAGAVASPLESKPYDMELMQCRRHYAVLPAYVAGYGTAGGTVSGQVTFPVQMRAAPAVTFSGQAYANGSALALLTSGPSALTARVTATAAGQASATATAALSADL